jgi:ATPase family protein associated with various cellular activities (AAA)
MKEIKYDFLREATVTINAGQTRTLILSGNIFDLFYLPPEKKQSTGAGSGSIGRYVPLVDFLTAKWKHPGCSILVVYELNGPIRFINPSDMDKMKEAWVKWKTGMTSDEIAIKGMFAQTREQLQRHKALSKLFESSLNGAIGHPTLALEFLRQLCLCSRSSIGGEICLKENLNIIVEGAHLLIPEAPIPQLSDADRHRISICRDWFSDPGYMNGNDTVIFLAESRSQMNSQLTRLPQVLEVEISSPDDKARMHFFEWFRTQLSGDKKIELWGTEDDLSKFTGGLSIHALRQLLVAASYRDGKLTQSDVISKVEDFIQQQLGEDVVEFKKPGHTLKDVIGFTRLKKFLHDELIPRFQSTGIDALPGAAVSGPIGGGKTFIFEALAAELDMVVLVLKNVRSKWFGQTDVIIERLRRVLNALDKAMIFMDEADTQLGGVGPETHDTERRLTGKIQTMMSDPAMRGRIVWLLMTARIHHLSPDIRRPGRVGDLIIPVLDPKGDDRKAFLSWMTSKVIQKKYEKIMKKYLDTAKSSSKRKSKKQKTIVEKEYLKFLEDLESVTARYSAASFASMRSELVAKAKGGSLPFDKIFWIINDHIPPAIEETRRYQTLQALINCTRRSLLPDPNIDEKTRNQWAAEIRALEARGIN